MPTLSIIHTNFIHPNRLPSAFRPYYFFPSFHTLCTMRPSAVRMSEMPGGRVYNLWWGTKEGAVKQKGVVTYTVSPFRQRAVKGLFKGYLFNGYRRLSAQFGYWVVPVVIGYSTYAWAKKHDAWQNSKAGHIAGAHH